ncbi:hypothetical protein [Roseibium sp. Sym1]|uniref:hypothetical protein n=1 Tax=Roseibium sp. Sym1 TaxID=3016006 RepID=UPI0022B54662|nr:hypothetical protein [Roseibium sp. Sym1]
MMAKQAKQIAEETLNKLHELKVTFNMTRLIMQDEARADAGEVVQEIDQFIKDQRKALATAK